MTTKKIVRFQVLVAAAVLAVLFASARTVRADIVILADGRKLEGEVTEDGDSYIVKGRFGTATRIPKYMVIEIRKTESPRDKFEKRKKSLEAKREKATVEEWTGLSGFAIENNLAPQAREIYRKIVSIDPDNETARRALGHVLYQGVWMPDDEAMTLKGFVKVKGRWVTKEEADKAARRGKERRRSALPDPSGLATAAADAFAPKYEDCPNCGGTGIAVWIPCHQCERSKRPGYCFNGQIFFQCPRCKGTARFPGIRCAQCRGTGKINPKKPRTVTGKEIPKGFRLCPDCSGTGALEWIKCPQCARSRHPGYCYFGERYTVCQKCKGAAKLPALWCGRCQRSGLVQEGR